MIRFQSLLDHLASQPRLRWGLWLILGIIWLNLDLSLRDQVKARTATFQQTERNLARTQNQATQSEWLERAETARLAKVALEETLWKAGTQGLAQAEFQDWLNRQFTSAGIPRPNIHVSLFNPEQESTASMPGDLWRVGAKLQFDFDPKSLTDVLRRIASNKQRIVVESITVRQQPTPRVEAQLSAYFLATSAKP